MIRATALALFGALVSSDAMAQAPLPPERPAEADAQAGKGSPGSDTPPYQLKLEHLAELMGTLAFLRDLCPAGDGVLWREKMESLLAAEGSTPLRRNRLAGAFNAGFESYRISYRRCTPAAQLVIERALGDGSRLSRELSAQFGN